MSDWPKADINLLRSEITVPIGAGNTPIHKKVAASDETAVRAHEQSCDGRDFVRRASATGWRERNHAPVAFTAWSSEFIFLQAAS